MGVRSSVGAPIKLDDELWGTIGVHSKTQTLPPDTEARLERFAALVGTALTSAQARREVRRLADEQAALRRVATLVAQQTPQEEVFAAIAEEIGRLLAVDSIQMIRYVDDRDAVVVAGWGALIPAAERDARPARRPERRPRRSSAPAAPPASTTTATRAARSPTHVRPQACARPWAPRSSSRAGCGAPWSRPAR